MPKGHHYGHSQKRAYTISYQHITAKIFTALLDSPLGQYNINSKRLSSEHCTFTLASTTGGVKYIVFTINNKEHQIALITDNRSASNKLYISCPYCQKKRQHLYAIKTAYACRQCIGLHYATQSEDHHARLMRRIRKLRANLWGNDWPDINNMFVNVYHWPKPKGKRWDSFYKKRAELIKLEALYWPMAVKRIDAIGRNCSKK